MRIAFFDTHRFDRAAFEEANAAFGHALTWFEPRLTQQTAGLATGFPAVCSFVNDRLDGACLQALADGGTRLVALRSAGFNHVDLVQAGRLGLTVVRVPEYSPQAVAEHTAALVLALNRKVHRAYARVREWNFSLDGLVGFDMYGKTVALVGLGRIGRAAARIFRGFGCRLLGVDPRLSAEDARELGLEPVELAEALRQADIVSLHVPLTPATRHLIDAAALAKMKPGAMIINTGRGALLDSHALVEALKSGHLGAAGLDVYEEEEGIFFQDLSEQVLQDDVLARLLTFPNVLITAHQAFLTREALHAIARTTLESVQRFERGEPAGPTEVRAEQAIKG
ncbi:2-hydroxyacid dehydrogenase [Corallococcus llansteffanensis]|uniref:2-hydroxyacid dehydrogenase n=1 Tax=Corallococcus llansteffanensis TaxID=2316731 RepID=A0A3A8PZR2_9BACT|nr:2-hydroxyacid dehydrogenase [Corallococcus llansteffanensis]RKH61977.1 2-hydroxyacid dehydrogenase [Corallococcus llansteffanensis]